MKAALGSEMGLVMMHRAWVLTGLALFQMLWMCDLYVNDNLIEYKSVRFAPVYPSLDRDFQARVPHAFNL